MIGVESLSMVIVDLSFRINGSEIPADHGYALFSAVSRLIPSLHGDESIGIHPISGLLVGERLLRITERSRLVFRMDSKRISDVMPLSGKRLDVGGHELLVGLPTPFVLRPATTLRSRIVVIKGFLEVEPFLEACRRQLSDMGVIGEVSLPVRMWSEPLERGKGHETKFIRRTIRIHDKVIVGYAVQVGSLNQQGSLKLQEVGLGGRRRFGCGIFLPYKSDEAC
jgi:CRISPR-associated protein Cas6